TDKLTEHLRTLGNLDNCARVTVRPHGAGVVLEITTSDGRSATRQVRSVAALLRTTEALLEMPPPEPIRPAAKPSPLEVPPADPAPPRPRVTSMHFELGAGGSLRFGGGPLYAGGGVASFAGFILDRWLLGMSARWDLTDGFVSQLTPGNFSMRSSAYGVSIGNRFELGETSADALFGPTIVLEHEHADDSDTEIHGDADDFRLALALRISGPRSSPIRAFATSDFEASPARIRSQKFIDRSLPQLPWWSGGLAVGVLWGPR
ncbi:MAG TPA: hypothetical protein VK745_16375, partial [Polyangiaceae bacterium]|nr:hypothetical protein [Polyangiaceae bacterium]